MSLSARPLVIFVFVLLTAWWFITRDGAPPERSVNTKPSLLEGAVVFPSETASSPLKPTPASVLSKSAATRAAVQVTARSLAPEAPTEGKLPSSRKFPARVPRSFSVDEDGIAVSEGDIALGLPPNGESEGVAAVPMIQLWPSRVIPYHIQPDVERPERIHEALQMFADTAVRFVPYTSEEDAIVFQNGDGHCKSYVGRVGGKQAIWLSAKCGPPEIAHELMHSIGFIHEQNRTDRDSYIRVLPDSIDDKFKTNFDLMPPPFMQLSGLAEFSFDSIMIYPPTMFSRNALLTMIPLRDGQTIAPGSSLNDRDKLRIQKYYGNL